MPEAGGVVVLVLLEHLDEVDGHGPQLVHLACHILDEHAGAGLARPAHDGDEAFPHVPVHLVLLLLLCEGVRLQGLGGLEPALDQRRLDLVDALVQLLLRLPAALHQERAGHLGAAHEAVHEAQHVLVGLALAQGGAVEHLHGIHAGFAAQHGGALARIQHAIKHDEGARLVGVLGHGVVRGARHEAEGALGSDHEPLDDFDGVVRGEVHEGIEGVARGALDGKLLANERAQVLVGLHALRQVHDALDEAGVRGHEGLDADGVGRVEHSAIHKHDAHVLQGVVGVLGHAAAHARGVVGDDAPNHARVDGGGIGPDLVLLRGVVLLVVGREDAVHLPANQPRFHRHRRAITVDLELAEVLAGVADLKKDRVGQRLARERGAGGTEGDRHAELLRDGQDFLHVLLGVHLDDEAGVEAVERSVRAVGEGTDGVGELAGLRDELGDLLHEGRVAAVLDSLPVLVHEHGGLGAGRRLHDGLGGLLHALLGRNGGSPHLHAGAAGRAELLAGRAHASRFTWPSGTGRAALGASPARRGVEGAGRMLGGPASSSECSRSPHWCRGRCTTSV
mmetsp:Transcript_6282/g.21566  ORF Transcript_6282/g.21566 Transcript_6282/m.21566 type:complete len:564 (+) Transcript_6282:1578-3269(+)